MKEILTYALGVAVCCGLFIGFYRMVLYQRISFRTARIYLIASMVVSAIIPALDIPVWKTAPMEIPAFDVFAITAAENPVTVNEAPRDHWQTALWGIYGLGAAALISIMMLQAVRIRRMKRRSEVYAAGEYEVAVSAEVQAPFSFLSTVYLEHGTPPDEMRQIILHETSHIRHRHSVEKIIMETLKTLMWFNPFAWIASRLLNEVHEFEADRDVLQGGCTVEEYLPVIFRQVFGYTPEISTGLGNSLTKKRFEMMIKKMNHGRYSWLRTAGVLPIAAGMLMLFGFTHRPPEIIMQKSETKEAPESYDATAVYGTPLQTTGKATLVMDQLTINSNALVSSGEAMLVVDSPQMNKNVFFWVLGKNPHELTGVDISAVDPSTIESFSVLKSGNYPDEIVKAMGDRKFDGVIIIEPKEGFPGNAVATGKAMDLTQIQIAQQENPAPGHNLTVRGGGEPFVWIAGDNPHELRGDINDIPTDQIESISVLKNGNYPDEVVKAMGGRKFDGVIVITLKNDGQQVIVADHASAAPAITNSITNDITPTEVTLFWNQNEQREMTKEEIAKINADNVQSLSVIKSRDMIEEVYGELIGNRKVDNVWIVEFKVPGIDKVTNRIQASLTRNSRGKVSVMVDGKAQKTEKYLLRVLKSTDGDRIETIDYLELDDIDPNDVRNVEIIKTTINGEPRIDEIDGKKYEGYIYIMLK